ncbi:RNA polymerase II degradation factor 1-like [Zootermopsis nevadensis]|uniref:RNA polymerase II degradation factor 1-like n=1 Tax=Zootermopsis nevadensis TaxID=136037 RepID=UPI000B8EA7D3|nr:RNA polymerase II degradation factor 1-like [Zootermopsis nevadensis]
MKLVVLMLITSLLGNFCIAKQSEETSSLIWNNADRGNPPSPPLKLDPALRRALLRALTQLELEAQSKSAGADPTGNTTPPGEGSGSDEQEANIKRDLEELLGNYENGFQPPKEPQPPDTPKDNNEMIVLDEQNSQPADDVSVIDYDVPDDKTQPPEDLQRHETASFLEKPQDSAIFFQDQQRESQKTTIAEEKPETDVSTPIDIQTNIIPSSTQVTGTDITSNTGRRESDQDSNAVETSSTSKNAVVKSTDPTLANGVTKLDLDDQDVSIFQAPLVAAFTLQQDEKGNPKRVVPLLRRPQSPLVTPRQRLPLSREQELEQKTRLLEQQLIQLQQQQHFQQQQQFQQHQQQLLKQQQLLQQEQLRQRQQQLFLEEQQRLRLQQQSFLPLGPPPSPQRQRPQRQETGTGIVDFQQSVGFQYRQQPNTPFPQQFVPNTFQQGSNPATTDFVFKNQNTLRQSVHPPSVNSQLQNLLYQSGVAGDLQNNGASPQEDLNIVSKILSLNHEGRANRPGRETLEPPSRIIRPPFP